MSVMRFPIHSLLAAASLLFAPTGHGAERPNFIVITIDDLGYADIGPFGSTIHRTPHLDRMAREGRKLTSFYAAPVCSPSRAALMTGAHPKRALPIPHVLFPAGAVGLNPAEVTVAEVLRDAGYATGCIGKWHLGDQPAFLPTAQGFDYYLGIPYSNDMGTAADGSKSDLGAPVPSPDAAPPTSRTAQAAPEDAETGLKGHSQPPLPLVENDRVIDRLRQDGQQRVLETFTTAAVKYIREHREKPFFLYLPHSAVHFPLYPGAAWVGRSGKGLYADWVEEVDDSVGRVLDTVRELGLEKRTMVIFTSDNGGTPRGSNAPLRGHKGSTWEGGIRVPTIAWWPGRVPAGTSTDAIGGNHDLLPTLAALGGGTVPTDRRLDGMDLSPVLLGAADAKGHTVFPYFRGFELQALREGPWKLHFGVPPTPAQAKGKDKGKGKAKGNPNGRPTGLQLYHLEDDPGETRDVAAEHPDVVSRLQALAAEMDADLGRTERGPGIRPLGRVEQPEPFIHQDGTVRANAVGQKAAFP